MIIKHEGKKINVHPWEYTAMSLYNVYQTIATVYYREKTKGWYDTWGRFGFGTTTVGLILSMAMFIWISTYSEINWVVRVVYYGYLVFYLYATYRRVKGPVSMKNAESLPRFSDSGYPLKLVSYDPTLQHDPKDVHTFSERYYNIECSPTTENVAEPLKEPVIVDGYKVIGAYVETELHEVMEDDELHQNLSTPKYWLVLEGGYDLRVEPEYFREVVLNLQNTANGDEYWVPVLSGMKQSVIVGAILDMVNACVASLSNRGLSTEEYLQEFGNTLAICETALTLLEKDHPIHERIA